MAENFITYADGKKVEGKLPATIFPDALGVFESLRVYQGKVFRARDHYDRLRESIVTSGLSCSLTAEKFVKEVQGALSAYLKEKPEARKKDLFIRFNLWTAALYLMIGERAPSPELFRTGVRLQTSPVRRAHPNAHPTQVKTTAYQNAVLATLEPTAPGTFESLFLDQNGYVTEVRIGNIFTIKSGSRSRQPLLLTPPTTGILNGVTRRVVIECALRLGLNVKEIPMTRHDIFTAQEAFLTNTSWQILPVAQLDGRTIGGSISGPVTQKLQRTFQDVIKKECS